MESEKSARVISRVSDALSDPLVPVTLKVRVLPFTAVRLLTISAALSPGTIEAGLKVHRAGALPAHAKLMLPLEAYGLEVEIVKPAESAPLMTAADVLSAMRAKAEALPPERPTACGLPMALSEIVSVPDLTPVAVGVKVTSIAQPAPAATLVPHVWVSEKSPTVETAAISSGAVPRLVTFTACGKLVVPIG